MELNQEQFLQLNRIYNTLRLISTKGEDTELMANCQQALRALIQELQSPKAKEETIEIPLNRVSMTQE